MGKVFRRQSLIIEHCHQLWDSNDIRCINYHPAINRFCVVIDWRRAIISSTVYTGIKLQASSSKPVNKETRKYFF